MAKKWFGTIIILIVSTKTGRGEALEQNKSRYVKIIRAEIVPRKLVKDNIM